MDPLWLSASGVTLPAKQLKPFLKTVSRIADKLTLYRWF
jgi:hypothetical protein